MSRAGRPHLPTGGAMPTIEDEPRVRWPPRTAADLQRLWDIRDHRYTLRRSGLLTQQEKASIGAARRFDVLTLPEDQQAVGQRMLVRHGWA